MEKIEFRGVWVRGDFYNAADVDALLAGVRRLVEVLDHPYLEDSPEATNCPICKAIAAVERLIGGSDDTR